MRVKEMVAIALLWGANTGYSEGDIPSLEFFEYLGSLVEEEDGDWLGPEDMDSPVFAEVSEASERVEPETQALIEDVSDVEETR